MIYIPIEVEHFLSIVLGKRSTHGLTGFHQRSIWIKTLKRLFKHFEKYVEANFLSDTLHEHQLHNSLVKLKGSIKPGASEVEITAILFELCFLLLGNIPDHWRKKTINRPEYFVLDRFRTLHYSQSPKQKAELIIKTYIEPELTRNDKRGENAESIWLKYLRFHNKQHRHAEFVRWFKENYKNQYEELFV